MNEDSSNDFFSRIQLHYSYLMEIKIHENTEDISWISHENMEDIRWKSRENMEDIGYKLKSCLVLNNRLFQSLFSRFH